MTEVLTDEAAAATASARAAAVAAGVELRQLMTLGEMRAAGAIVRGIWGGDHMPVHLQRAVAHAGSYVCGAVRDGEVLGALLGILGLRDDELVLHSHIAGVQEGSQGRAIGFALKQHQRAWALERGVRRVTWTFDPLVRRNAYFNLTKLAAVGTSYEENFYGPLRDGINAGEESDRLLVEWRLDDPAVAAAAGGHASSVDVSALRDNGASVRLEADEDGGPRVRERRGDVLLCQIPNDIVAFRADPGTRSLSDRWRRALRETLGVAIEDGYEATGMSRDGWYVLTRAEGAGR